MFDISHLDDAVVFKNVFSLDSTRNFFTGREKYYIKRVTSEEWGFFSGYVKLNEQKQSPGDVLLKRCS